MSPHEPPEPAAVRADYDRSAPGYDDRHGDPQSVRKFRVIEAPLCRVASRAERLLDLGCGTGRLLEHLPGRGQRLGVDLSLGMLGFAAARGLAVAAADAHRLPFADRAFDAVIAAKGVFRYLDYPVAFAECARVLGPGGALAIHQYAARTFSPRQLFRTAAGEEEHQLHVNRLDELTRPAARAGLEVDEVRFFRSVRVYPYAIEVPGWLPGDLWSHVVVVFRRGR